LRPSTEAAGSIHVIPQPHEWQRASRREIAILTVYFVAVVLATDAANVRLGVELLVLAVLLPALLVTPAPHLFFKDWWFFFTGLVMWNLSGPIAAESPFPWHLEFMYTVDHTLFFGHNPVQLLQQHLQTPGVVSPLDYICSIGYNLHLPEPFMVGYILWRMNRVIYLQYATAVLVLLVVGLITFIVFPAVPPWMAAWPLVGFHGQYLRPWYAAPAGYPGGLHAAWKHAHVLLPGVANGFNAVLKSYPLPFHGTPLFYIFKFRGDSVAAFPSEHAAFPMLELLAFRAVTRRFWYVVAVWVLFVLFTIVFLGEHWVTDALVGYLYALVIWGAVRWFSARRRTGNPASALAAGGRMSSVG
jgi:hypothetical protein